MGGKEGVKEMSGDNPGKTMKISEIVYFNHYC